MRYHRQAYEINVRLPAGAVDNNQQAALAETFHEAHERLYGRRDPRGVVQFVTLCVTATGNSRRLAHQPLAAGDGDPSRARKTTRNVYFRDHGFAQCAVYHRALLRAGDVLAGPTLLEAADSTTVVPPGWNVKCDAIGNLIVTHERKAA
jgi:N-methylhydantoinase A